MKSIVGIIGSGMIGSTVARLAVSAGLQVVVSNSRAPESLAELVRELGAKATAATPQQAAAAGDLVVATVPLRAYGQLPVEELTGKTVIDTMNYYPERDGRIAELDQDTVTSSELVQRHLAGAHVVKALNSIDFRRLSELGRRPGSADRSALPIAGNDSRAKAQAAGLLDALGFDAVDIGTLVESWRSQPGTPVYVQPYQPARPREMREDEARRWFFESPSIPVTATQVAELVASAARD